MSDDRPRFLCDEMLERLGRYLRAAGYDTAIAGRGVPDELLLERAAAEDRLLLTCDRELAARRRGGGRVLVLPPNGLDAGARALRELLGLDWTGAPFTRCIVDNALLRAAGDAERAVVPPRARALGGDVSVCPACRRLYWPGSHLRRMRARLEGWRDGRE